MNAETIITSVIPTGDDKRAGRGASLRLNGVRKVYGQNVVNDDISIDIEPGQFVTLLGASGSGKTTLLRMIAGFLEPTAGRIDLDGVDITSVPVHKRNIGMVFQSYALFPHMSVAKNVAFPLEMHKVRKADRARLVDEALAAVKLSGFGDRMPSQLSGGQQQRVALARAIVMRPRLLLMDEPLGALDRRLREAMQIEILRLSRELGLTVINVTHDQEEAYTMSDRIALLSDGKLVQYDAPEALYQSPVSEAAAEFLGESNRFSGILNIDGDRAWVDAGEVTVGVAPSSLGPFGHGEPVVAVVRPWAVSIRKGEADGSRLSGVVAAAVYAGDSRKILVDTGLGSDIIVRQLLDDAESVAAGDVVSLSWRDDLVVLTAP